MWTLMDILGDRLSPTDGDFLPRWRGESNMFHMQEPLLPKPMLIEYG